MDLLTLSSAFECQTSASAQQWLSDHISALQKNPDNELTLDIAIASARRESGTKSLGIGLFKADDAARVLLLSAVASLTLEWSERVYRHGDLAEREAVLKGLAILDPGGALINLALDAARSNQDSSVAALACHNPYPAHHFPEGPFNQLVLKAAFMGIDLGRIEGLASRTNEDLSRMCYDYARERHAAGRAIPASLGLALNTSLAKKVQQFTS